MVDGIFADPEEEAVARYPNIADHGLIGDLQTAALVTTDGVLDWFCCPRFDSPSVFASLLDADRGGFYRIAPDRDDYVSQAAVPARHRGPDHPVHDPRRGRRGARLHAGHRGPGDRPAPAGAQHPGGPRGHAVRDRDPAALRLRPQAARAGGLRAWRGVPVRGPGADGARHRAGGSHPAGGGGHAAARRRRRAVDPDPAGGRVRGSGPGVDGRHAPARDPRGGAAAGG